MGRRDQMTRRGGDWLRMGDRSEGGESNAQGLGIVTEM
jgi:hypothetical protein